MMHTLKRRISFILIFTLIFSFINIKVFADIFNSSSSAEDAPNITEIPKKEAKIIKFDSNILTELLQKNTTEQKGLDTNMMQAEI